ncbi:MAG: hypothetical protein WCH78_06965 [Bacteroidota bacterium]
MRKSNSSILLAFVFIFFSNVDFAQDIDSMMNVYADRSAPERIHIHFDKNIYNKGETIWYKAYILQGSDTGSASMNVYLEWYAADGKPISRSVAPIVLSASSGSFDIPTDYKGELIEVRAYTRWMLNDDPAFLYRRQLVINNSSSKTPDPPPSKTNVIVFPEGGYLIQRLPTRIAFKAVNSFGNPVLIKGVLTDDANNILDSIQVLHDGMGSFFLTALPEHQYQLKWTDEFGVSGITPLTITKSEGAQLTVTRQKDKALFRIERSENVPDNFKNLTLVIHMNHVGLYQVAINESEKTNLNAEIPVIDLPTGLLQFTLFTSDWIPIAERVVFINNHKHELNIDINTPLINTTARGKNALDLFVQDTLFTNMSMAITDADVSLADQHTIFSDIFLASEIKGKVYNPGYYLSGNTDEIAEHLDLVMLTNGWRRFDWEKIKAHIGPKIEHPKENEYMKLIGKVSGIKSDKAGELNMIIISKDSSRQFVSAPLQKDGSFEQPIILFDTAKILYSINNDQSLSEKATLQIQNSLLQLSPKNISPLNIDLSTGFDIQVKQKLDNLLAKQELLRKKMAETTLKEVVVTAMIKTPERRLDEKYSSGFFKESPAKKAYILDMTDPKMVTSANTVIEYLVNRIPGLNVSPSGSMQWRGSGPVFYLNEVRADLATLLTVPLISVAMIKAFPPIFMFATGAGAGGAIAVYTKNGNDYIAPELPGLQTVQLSGYTLFKEFYNPNYDQPENGFVKPDNRTTLYWNPHLITNKAQQQLRVEFFNNDITKSFKVVLEGINAAGKMTHIEKTIGVN